MNQIEEICKEAIFIKAGKIVDQGEILDLKKKYGDNRLTIELDQSIQEKLEEHNIIYNLVSNHIKISIQNREQLHFIYSLIAEGSFKDIPNFSYENISLNELFIDLLGSQEGD